jgi:hypothetical protein
MSNKAKEQKGSNVLHRYFSAKGKYSHARNKKYYRETEKWRNEIAFRAVEQKIPV